ESNRESSSDHRKSPARARSLRRLRTRTGNSAAALPRGRRNPGLHLQVNERKARLTHESSKSSQRSGDGGGKRSVPSLRSHHEDVERDGGAARGSRAHG